MDRFDVAIIGAGPAGSSAAIMLARKGYCVALLDRRFFPREKLCGDFLSPINWPLFEDLGVAAKILSLEHQRVTAFRISSFSGAEAALEFPRGAGLDFGLGMSRFYLDDLLVERARREGTCIKQGQGLGALFREKGEWTVTLGRPSAEAKLHATFLIGADGRNSWVAERLGLKRLPRGRQDAVAFQLYLRGVRRLGGEVQIHLFPGGYAGLVGLGGGMTNLCLTVETKVKRDLPLEAVIENYVCRNPHLKELLREAEIIGDARSAYPVYFSPRRSYGDGFLLAGDAACVTEPVTGEGIYFALQSGVLAAAAVDLAFATGDFSARRLSAYHGACLSAFSRRRRVNGLIRALIHRPLLLSRLIQLSSKTSFPMRHLVGWVCAARDPRSRA